MGMIRWPSRPPCAFTILSITLYERRASPWSWLPAPSAALAEPEFVTYASPMLTLVAVTPGGAPPPPVVVPLEVVPPPAVVPPEPVVVPPPTDPPVELAPPRLPPPSEPPEPAPD